MVGAWILLLVSMIELDVGFSLVRTFFFKFNL